MKCPRLRVPSSLPNEPDCRVARDRRKGSGPIAATGEHRINDRIRVREVRLVGPDGTQLGIKPAPEALSIGLINRVESLDDLDAVVDELAGRLASGPSVALSLAKGLLDNAARTSFEQALEDEGRAQSVNFETADLREAMTAFFEKRPPTFTGR